MRTTVDCYNWLKKADPTAKYFFFRPTGNFHCSSCPPTYKGTREGLSGNDCDVFEMQGNSIKQYGGCNTFNAAGKRA